MPAAGAGTGFGTGLELPAWRRAPIVDGTSHLFANAAGQCGTARQRMIGAAQTA